MSGFPKDGAFADRERFATQRERRRQETPQEEVRCRGNKMKINAVKNRMIQTLVPIAALCILGSGKLSAESRPNILLCISDDQSYAHTGANGDPDARV